MTGLEPSSYLSNDIGRFSEILTPADVGARQEVLNQTHSDVVTPVKESNADIAKGITSFLLVMVEETAQRRNDSLHDIKKKI